MVSFSSSRVPEVLIRRAIRRGTPLGLMRSFKSEVDEMLGIFSQPARLNSAAHHRAAAPFPRINLEDTQGSITLRAELPGVSPDAVSVEVLSDTVTISGARPSVTDKDDERLVREERFSGEFCRKVKLPFEANPDNVEASFVDGILTVSISRPEATKPRKITISSK